MISDPQKYCDEFIKSGANLIVFHIEAMKNKEETLQLISHIKEQNVQVGISIKTRWLLSRMGTNATVFIGMW